MSIMLRRFVTIGVILGVVSDTVVSSSCPTPAIRNGAAKLKKRGLTVRFRCYKRFVLVGPVESKCLSGSWLPSEPPVCISTGCLPHPQVQNTVVSSLATLSGVSVPAGSVLQYSCAPGHVMDGSAVSWCDGVLWNSSAPLCTLPFTPPRLSCNFNDVDVPRLCGWGQALEDDLDWTLTNRSTPTVGTGPDFALEGNFFLYLEASGRAENDTARLVSPVYPANYSQAACLQLAVYMKGTDMGGLRIGQGLEGLQRDLRILDELWGEIGPEWRIVLVDIQPVTENFQLFIDGIVGASYLSDVAIDAIRILQGSDCQTAHGAYKRPITVTTKKLSPASCWGRCDSNGTSAMARHGWTEGACDCSPSCLVGLGQCCMDYLLECSIGKVSPRMEVAGWKVWSTLTGASCLVIVGLVIILAASRWRIRPQRLDGGEEDDDMRRMVDEDREDRRRTETVDSEYIDFSLALATDVEEAVGGNVSTI